MSTTIIPPARRLAADLLTIQAVTFSPASPYTWASGLRSPIYCDNRLSMAYPRIRGHIAEGFEAVIDAQHLKPDVIVGTATAGIAHAAWLADRLRLPMAYVRSSAKKHGRGNQIEGRVVAGQHVVVVEDLVSTGGSSIKVVEALRTAGLQVDAVLAIFSYDLPRARAAFEKAKVPLHTLLTFEDLLAEAGQQGALSAAEVSSLEAWHQDPIKWSEGRSA